MNGARERIPLSLIAVLVLWGVLACGVLRSPPGNILSWDTFGYHLYLPATLIHADPGIHDPSWVRAANDAYGSTGTLYQISELPDGRWVDKYPMGLAMLWSPFFVGAHAVAGWTGAPQDGFSAPYQWGLIVAALCYMLVGLWVLRKVLLFFFPDAIVAAVLALIVMGTNYFHQAVHGTGMPHIFLFTLGAGVLLQSVSWYRTRSRKHALLLGLLLGLFVVSRPSEIVWILVPLLIGAPAANGWKAYPASLWPVRAHLLLMAAAATLVCFPQLAYWKWMTGRWLYMSYNNPGEGFEFLHPYTWEVLFSFRKGWFVYTPLMLVAVLGILLLRRYAPVMRWPVIAFFVLNLYIVSSWSCWWYADSFGQRALVQSYPLMALPLGAVLCWVKEQRMRWMMPGIAALLLLVVLNLFQTHQSIHGLIHTSRMTWPAYKAVFGTMHAPEDLSALWSVERSYTGENGGPDLRRYRRHRLVTLGFEEGAGGNDTIAFRGTGSYRLGPGDEFSPGWDRSWGELTRCGHCWLEASCMVQRPPDGSSPALSLVTTFGHKGNNYGYMAQDVRLDDAAPGGWQRLHLWYLSPEIRRPDDRVKVYCWLRDTLPVRVDELEVILYEPVHEP